MIISRCCRTEIYVAGANDFNWDRQLCTQWYECSRCYRPCDTMILSQANKELGNESV